MYFGRSNAPKAYFKGLKKHLLKHSYSKLTADRCVYVKRNDTGFIVIPVVLNDCVITTTSCDM